MDNAEVRVRTPKQKSEGSAKLSAVRAVPLKNAGRATCAEYSFVRLRFETYLLVSLKEMRY
jgi:hypothetical protein